MVEDQPFSIAIDLGGTQVRAALFDGDKIIERAAVQTDVDGGPEAVVDQMAALVEQVSGKINLKSCRGIGLSTAGPVDTIAGVTLGIPTLPGWDGFPILVKLEKCFSLPVQVENDAIASALGEWRHGAGRDLDNLVYITASTGIGGGVIVDGHLLHGRKGMAAHVGHMRMAQDGPKCGCGAIGCFEALASGTAMARRAIKASQEIGSGYLGKIAETKTVSAIDVFDGARIGDSQCKTLVEEQAQYLGQGITSLIHLFSPERVILGGGMMANFDMLKPGIDRVVERDAMNPFKSVEIVRSELGDNSGLFGAASLMQNQTA